MGFRRFRRVQMTLVAVVTSLAWVQLAAAELGDINGDGRVSFADALLLDRIEPAPGSTDFAGLIDCTPYSEESRFGNGTMSSLIYLEALRRASGSFMPHFIEEWPAPVAPLVPPPPPDDRVILEVESRSYSGSARALDLRVRLTTFVELAGVNLVLRGDEIDLRPPRHEDQRDLNAPRALLSAYLLSDGALAFPAHGRPVFQPGETVFELPVELVRGTPAATYRIDFAAGTEAVTTDGEVLVPELVPGDLTLRRTITDGNPLPYPPLDLRLELDPRRVLGGAEIRFRDVPPVVRPGETFSLTLEQRLGRPANRISAVVWYPYSRLRVEGIEPLAADPSTGEVDPRQYRIAFAGSSGQFSVHFFLHRESWTNPYERGDSRYIASGEDWFDLARVHFRVPDGTGPGDAMLRFDTGLHGGGGPTFSPYRPYGNIWGATECRETGKYFEYEPQTYQDAIIVTESEVDPEPPPPPVAPEVAGITYEVGAARGDRGDIVALAVSLETRVELYQLRLVLGFDPDAFELVGFEVPLVDPLGDPIEPALLAPGEGTRFVNEFCAEGPAPGGTVCTAGLPMLGLLRLPPLDDVPPGHLVVDLQSTYIFGRGEAHPGPLGWEARREHTMGTAFFRIRDDARDGRYELPGVEVEWTPEEQAAERVRSTSAGYPLLEAETERADVPALRVVSGVITVGEVFTRGDADGDGAVILTDAVFLLNHLFLGAAPPACLDAADADDDGALNLTDSVALLNFLFLGGAPPPAPHPEPGGDPTPDGLHCASRIVP